MKQERQVKGENKSVKTALERLHKDFQHGVIDKGNYGNNGLTLKALIC